MDVERGQGVHEDGEIDNARRREIIVYADSNKSALAGFGRPYEQKLRKQLQARTRNVRLLGQGSFFIILVHMYLKLRFSYLSFVESINQY